MGGFCIGSNKICYIIIHISHLLYLGHMLLVKTNPEEIGVKMRLILLFLTINHIQQRISLGRRRQILTPRLRNQDAILHTHASNGVIPLQHIPLDEAGVLGVVAEVSLEIIA